MIRPMTTRANGDRSGEEVGRQPRDSRLYTKFASSCELPVKKQVQLSKHLMDISCNLGVHSNSAMIRASVYSFHLGNQRQDVSEDAKCGKQGRKPSCSISRATSPTARMITSRMLAMITSRMLAMNLEQKVKLWMSCSEQSSGIRRFSISHATD